MATYLWLQAAREFRWRSSHCRNARETCTQTMRTMLPFRSAGLGRYLPIEEHGIVGDLRTIALVGTEGTIDWYCPARFDAPSLFAALLDARQGGYFSLACGATS